MEERQQLENFGYKEELKRSLTFWDLLNKSIEERSQG